MFHFFQYLATKTIGALAGVIIAVGIVKMPHEVVPPVVVQHRDAASTSQSIFSTTTSPISVSTTSVIAKNKNNISDLVVEETKQASVNSGSAIYDACKNLAGVQGAVPTGWNVKDGVCSIPKTVVSLNDVVTELQKQNQILQSALDLQKAAADKIKAEEDAQATAEQAAADLAAQQATEAAAAQAKAAADLAAQQAEQARIDAEIAKQKAEAAAVAPYYTDVQMRGEVGRALYIVSSVCQPCIGLEDKNRIYAVSFSRKWGYWRDEYRVIFNGQSVFEGKNAVQTVIFDNLNPGQTYTYQFIIPGEERHADSVYNGKFTTASSEPLTSKAQIQRMDFYGVDKFGTDGWGFLNPFL